MNIFSKRLSVVALSVTTLMWAVGAMQVPVAHAVAAGSLIKASGAAVYYLAADGKRYTFPNDKIYRTWYSDFSGVQTISDAELASYYIGGNVKQRAGTRLVKITTDPRVYAVEPTGILRHVPDEATAIALYGNNWNTQIDDLNDAFFAPPNYNIGSALPTGGATLPKGYLASDGTTTYYIDGTTKRPISGQAAMDASHFWSMYVHTVPASTLSGLTNGTSISGAEASLLDVSQGGTGGVIIPTGSGVTVSLAPDSPAANTLPDGTVYNPVLKFNVTASSDGDAQLTGLTITRGGFIANTNITGVSVWDSAGVRHGAILTSLGSDGRGTLGFGSNPIAIPAGQTRSVTVAINIDAGAGSGTVNASIASAADLTFTNSPSKNGSFPIVGNTMSVVDGSTTVGAVTVTGQTTVGAAAETDVESADEGNLEVGQTQMEVAKFQFQETSSREDMQIRQLVLYVEGSAANATDIRNFTVYGDDGVALGSAAMLDSENNATINLSPVYTLGDANGRTRNLTVKVDAMDGANNWFRVQLQNDYDILVRGVTTGANVAPTDADGIFGVTSTNGYFKIKRGALTITKNAASPSGNLTEGAQSVELARFDLTANGEALELRKLGIAVVSSHVSNLGLSGNLVIQDVGTGATYYTGTASSTTLYNEVDDNGTVVYTTVQTPLSNYINLASGQTRTIKVIGNISTNATSTNTIRIGIGNAYAKRISSNDYANVATGGSLASTLTIGGSSALTVTKHSTPPDPNTIAPGTQGATIATFAVGNQDTGSESVRVNSISVNAAFGGTEAITGLTNLKLYDITDATPVQLGSVISSPSANANAFTLSWTIPGNATRLLAIKGDISSAVASGGSLQASFTANVITGTGLTSNQAVQGPAAVVTGQLNSMAAAAVRVYFESDSSTLSKIVLAGTQNVELGKWRFEVSNEDVTLSKLTVRVSSSAAVTGTTGQASGTKVFGTFRLYNATTNALLSSSNIYQNDAGISTTCKFTDIDDTNLVTCNRRSASSTSDVIFSLGTPLLLPRGTGGLVSLKVDIANSGSGVTSTIASAFLRSNSNSDLEIRSTSQGLLAASSVQTTSTSGNGTETNKYLYQDVAPVVRSLAVTGAHVKGATDEIARFEVQNYGQVPIKLMELSFLVTASGFASSVSGTAGESTDRVQGLWLYDDAGNIIASSSNAWGYAKLCASVYPLLSDVACNVAVSTASSTYALAGSQSGGWEANNTVAAANGATPGSRIFSIRANTTNIAAAGGTGTRTLTVQVTGTKGFLSSDTNFNVSSTRFWNAGGVRYRFTPMEYPGDTYTLDASESFPVTAAQVSYQ